MRTLSPEKDKQGKELIAKISRLVEGGLSSVLYHWTPMLNAASILEGDKFKLASPNRSGDRSGYYYMSTTRSKTGGFHVNRKGVIFVLDGTALGKEHKGEAVDYYAKNQYLRPSEDTREGDEMEDRILSKKPTIEHASKYIKEAHLCLSTNDFTNEHYMGNVRNFIALAKQRNIPLYIYEFKDMLAWLNQDKRKAMPLEKFTAPVLSSTFNNWIDLTDEQIKQEYAWEYVSHQKRSGFDPWPTLKDFKKAVKEGEVETITEEKDRKVGNRSRCGDLEELKDLTSGYRFPRDVDRIVKGFKEGHPMPYPILLEQNGRRWVMSGNTRLDAAFILGITPKVLVVKVPSFKERVTSKYRLLHPSCLYKDGAWQSNLKTTTSFVDKVRKKYQINATLDIEKYLDEYYEFTDVKDYTWRYEEKYPLVNLYQTPFYTKKNGVPSLLMSGRRLKTSMATIIIRALPRLPRIQ